MPEEIGNGLRVETGAKGINGGGVPQIVETVSGNALLERHMYCVVAIVPPHGVTKNQIPQPLLPP